MKGHLKMKRNVQSQARLKADNAQDAGKEMLSRPGRRVGAESDYLIVSLRCLEG